MKFDIFKDVITNDVYKQLIKGVPEDELEKIEVVLKQFTQLLENNMLQGLVEMSEAARNATVVDVAEEMLAKNSEEEVDGAD